MTTAPYSSHQLFRAFIPLSNWIAGFDRYAFAFDKTHIPNNRFPGAFYVVPSADAAEQSVVIQKTQDLIKRLNIAGDAIVCLETNLPVGYGLAEPNTHTGTGIGWRWPSAKLPLTRVGWCHADGSIDFTHPEDLTARAFALQSTALAPWSACAPRSFSVLPIAQACNASCAFCFSKASISDAVIPQKINADSIRKWSKRARQFGANRAVITGGGEPTLLPFEQLSDLIEVLGADFSSVLLITNAHRLTQWDAKQGRAEAVRRLAHWRSMGLTRLAISRHGTTQEQDATLMGLAVDTPLAASLCHEAGLPARHICVLQKNGVATESAVKTYVIRSAQDGVDQICFKELYISSLSENPWGASQENLHCQENQVPLSIAIQSLTDMGFVETHRLPWGSPVFSGVVQGMSMSVAAYTEPSVGWERHNKIVRSWNLLASGQCLASLEDPSSVLPELTASRAIPVALVS